jgi:S1-C subfamily serine protease
VETEEGKVCIREVFEKSPARRAKLKEGDLIIALEGGEVSGVAELFRTLMGHHPGEKVSLVIQRGTKERKVRVELGKRPEGAPKGGFF